MVCFHSLIEVVDGVCSVIETLADVVETDNVVLPRPAGFACAG